MAANHVMKCAFFAIASVVGIVVFGFFDGKSLQVNCVEVERMSSAFLDSQLPAEPPNQIAAIEGMGYVDETPQVDLMVDPPDVSEEDPSVDGPVSDDYFGWRKVANAAARATNRRRMLRLMYSYRPLASQQNGHTSDHHGGNFRQPHEGFSHNRTYYLPAGYVAPAYGCAFGGPYMAQSWNCDLALLSNRLNAPFFSNPYMQRRPHTTSVLPPLFGHLRPPTS